MDAGLHRSEFDVAQRRRLDRRVWRNAFLAAALLHLAVFLLWGHTPVPISPFAAAGPRSGDNRAAAGSLQAMNIRTPPSVPIVPPPIPVPTLTDIEPVEFDDEQEFDPSALAGEMASLVGPGLEDGTGQGDGGDAEEGLNRLIPASPRNMILPPEALKGEAVEVWVFVTEDGRVVPDSTLLRPPTSDRNLNRTIIRDAAEWLFRPAQSDGVAIAAWFPYKMRRGGSPLPR